MEDVLYCQDRIVKVLLVQESTLMLLYRNQTYITGVYVAWRMFCTVTTGL